jgi:DNA-binding transcriptional MerR regulator
VDLETFLYLGQKINRAAKDDFDLLRLNVAQEMECEERQYLMTALEKRQSGPYRYYTDEQKETLLMLAKKWNGLTTEQQERVMDVLNEQRPVEDLGAGRSALLQFYELLCQFVQTEVPLERVKALLRIEEATAQFLFDSHGKRRPASSWKPHDSIRTFWP